MPLLELDLELRAGDFRLEARQQVLLEGVTALFGPSGSGKTTLLRIIAGLEPRAQGRLRFAGETWQQDRHRVPAHRRGATLLFQDVRLFPHLDVAGNLHYAARRAASGRSGPGQATVVEALQLQSLMMRRVASLSGGEAQRVAIARALLAKPRLLLMDEPLSALDQGRRAALLGIVAELPGRFGIPILYVTHAIDEVARLADRTALLDNGRLAEAEDTAGLLERLDLPRIAGGAGTGALLTARILEHQPDWQLSLLGFGTQRLSVPALAQAPGAEVRLRVQARDVALATSAPEGTSVRNVLAAKILSIDAQADSPYAEVLLDVDGAHLRSRITRASVTELALQPGLAVYALIKSVALADEHAD